MKKIIISLLSILILLSLTGCKDSYKGGTVKDGVYTHSRLGFKITPEASAVTYTGDKVKDSDHYIVCFNYAKNRGASTGFTCDYVVDAAVGELLVCSEENVKKLSLDEFAEKVTKELESGLLSYSVTENSDVTIDNVEFRCIKAGNDFNQVEYYIKEDGDRFTYIYFFYGNHSKIAGEKFLSYISGIE